MACSVIKLPDIELGFHAAFFGEHLMGSCIKRPAGDGRKLIGGEP